MSENVDRQYLAKSEVEMALVKEMYTEIEDTLRARGVSQAVLQSACVQVTHDLCCLAISRRGSIASWEDGGLSKTDDGDVLGGEW